MPTEHNKISPQMRELDTRQQLLVVTMEECGELIQSCSKLLRRAELYSDGQYVKNLKEELGELKRKKLSRWSELCQDEE